MQHLHTQIEILRKQIDKAKSSGITHNPLGVPIADQIADWERMIVTAEQELAK